MDDKLAPPPYGRDTGITTTVPTNSTITTDKGLLTQPWWESATAKIEVDSTHYFTLNLWQQKSHADVIRFGLTRNGAYPSPETLQKEWCCTVKPTSLPYFDLHWLPKRRSAHSVRDTFSMALGWWISHKRDQPLCADPSTCADVEVLRAMREHRRRCGCEVFGADIEPAGPNEWWCVILGSRKAARVFSVSRGGCARLE